MNKMIPKRYYVIFFVLVFCVMMILNFLTPMVSDDYAHYYGTEDIQPTKLGEIVYNMRNFRNEINGRVVSHFFVYVFLAIPRCIFRIVNAVVSAGIVIAFLRFFNDQWKAKSLMILLTCVFALWIFTPSFGEVYLWLTGSINYSWGLLFDLLLIYPFYCAYTGKQCRVLKKGNFIWRLLFLGFAFIVGAYSENGAIAAICVIAMLGLLLWINNRKLPLYLFSVFICACIGFCFLMTAPATLQGRTGGNIAEHIWFCRELSKKYMTVLWLIYLLLFGLAVFEKIDKRILLFTVILIFSSVLSIAVFVFAIYLPPRSFMIAVSFTILANCTLLSAVCKEKLSKAIILFLLPACTVFCVTFVKGCKDIVLLNHLQGVRETIIFESIENKQLDVVLPRFVTETDYSACPEEELSEDSQYWYNDLIARYYGLNTVTGMR